MPKQQQQPQQQQQATSTKKKKKGRAPSHQNAFAFAHNPKSKLTAKILASPNVGVCRRCRDKIEWRKKYRKYKPLTKPGRCNLCLKRNVVVAAYHTICSTCAGGAVALGRIGHGGGSKQKVKPKEGGGGSTRIMGDDCREDDNNDDGEAADVVGADGIVGDSQDNHALDDDIDDDDEGNDSRPHSSTPTKATKRHINDSSRADINSEFPISLRACAICVKEPALPDDEGDDEARVETKVRSDTELLEKRFGRTLKLRERKALERKVRKLVLGDGDGAGRQRQQEGMENSGGDDTAVAEDEVCSDAGKEEEEECTSLVDSNNGEEKPNGIGFKDGLEEDDPFLLAVGGADQLLTGDAYREMLLERQREGQGSKG